MDQTSTQAERERALVDFYANRMPANDRKLWNSFHHVGRLFFFKTDKLQVMLRKGGKPAASIAELGIGKLSLSFERGLQVQLLLPGDKVHIVQHVPTLLPDYPLFVWMPFHNIVNTTRTPGEGRATSANLAFKCPHSPETAGENIYLLKS